MEFVVFLRWLWRGTRRAGNVNRIAKGGGGVKRWLRARMAIHQSVGGFRRKRKTENGIAGVREMEITKRYHIHSNEHVAHH